MITNRLILINIVSFLIMDLNLQVSLAALFQGFNIKHFCVCTCTCWYGEFLWKTHLTQFLDINMRHS